ncbi:MAG: site-2 protease family protein [Ignavibacteriae bacterium]|nr:site-2 protease family protein [Ignavibacteriota bacterium]MCB9207147.1 site-2 protease family protein [Ignavibacteriales bacterium]MCB9218686.1 site-2 protease family protein [Ignavibacteriales bacterium]MCB9259308.1 site-2 protease family protein [Ignavibacteriales bacterium]
MGPYDLNSLLIGLPYSLSALFILATHEFGHYFAAKFHKVKATLPYFIPIPPISGFLNFGTMGAVIKTRSEIPTNKAMFDIGVSGPIAGFIASLIVLIYGFTHLPSQDYLLAIHPDYFDPSYGKETISLQFGNNLLFLFLKELFTNPSDFVPPMTEVYHYPYLMTGWFGLLITSMNMIPVGQLDGGHVVYSMFGSKIQEAVASISLIVLVVLGVSGIVDGALELNFGFGWSGWLFWGIILLLIIKVKHPPVRHFEQLDLTRKFLGYFSLLILIVCFAPSPFIITF